MRRSLIPFLACLCGLVTGCSRQNPERRSEPLLPQVSGTLTVDGLSGPVRIVRDVWGVPHIYAQTEHDVFFAQGFVQAQDRLFQLDLWRRSAQGRLSEVLGLNFVERDAMTRRMQYRGDFSAEWASYGPETKTIATAFVSGINAWVALARDRLAEEFTVAGWHPELWKADDLLNRTDAFVVSVDAELEIVRAQLVSAVGEPEARRLLAADTFVLPHGLDLAGINYVVADALRRVGTPPFFSGLAAPVAGRRVRGDSAQRGVRSLAADGRTVDANYDAPSRHYLVHLNAPGLNVIGATMPWVPGVIVGHNDRVAWDIVPYDADTQDIFVERVNPSNPHQVERQGRWIDTTIMKDPIAVKGRTKPFDFELELTPHGVIIASDREHNLVFTVRWSGTEPGGAGYLAAVLLNRARSWSEFHDALARWKMPAVKVSYRDVEGDNRRAIAALVPRRTSWNGDIPVPAWTGSYEWRGWQRSEDLPFDRDLAKVPLVMQKNTDRAEAPAVAEARHRWLSSMDRRNGPDISSAPSVMFVHPLGVTPAASQRFNLGPLTRASGDARTFYVNIDVDSWDRSVVMAAPGQSGSPDSPHYDDLAKRWAAGQSVPLVFSGAAVAENTETTLTLTPRVRKRP